MKICATIDVMRAASRSQRNPGSRLGLVPTMGALHEGHLSLVRAARAQCELVAASLFVNPLQFGPGEDLAKYPRDFDGDRALFEKEGVDFLFAPSVKEMYPAGAVTYVTVEGLSDRLCGRSRPGHFRGVTTVVSKLFHIVEPDLAFFGQKDAAQIAIIRRMVRDLDFPVQIVTCPIVREADGLAMSSRNAYLDSQQRKSALVLYRSLMEVQRSFDQGERIPAKLIEAGKHIFEEEPAARLDYFEIVNPETLEGLSEISGSALVAVAASVGKARLIDNIVLNPS
ncbi:MAG TPA: pantoate--beta-alanine ligase [Terriglobales bacterium]|jgi:pantoate--beta-alanine ligase|nr:pantoate--beta-alanine ligase [Terriglobales bacterium]